MINGTAHTIFTRARTFIYAVVFLLFSSNARSQTVLHSEDFESGGGGILLNTLDLAGTLLGDNPWTINSIYLGGIDIIPCIPPLPLIVPPTPLQPPGITNFPTSTYLHVTPQTALNIGGLLPSAGYVLSDGFCLFGNASTFSGMSTDVSTIGHDSVTLDLWWLCGGSELYYGEIYYSTDGGAAWLPVLNPLNGTNKWKDEILWTNTIVTDPNWDGQATLRFGFRFITGSSITGTETFPGFSVDDIAITGYDVCQPTSSTIAPVVCDQFTSPSGDSTWTQSGTYMDTLVNAEGCDSIMTIELIVNTVDTTVTQNGTELTSNASDADYQWVDCSNGHVAVALATNQTLAAMADGSYAVVVTQHGCSDTSGCYAVFGTGLYEFNPGTITIQPNPADDYVILISSAELSGHVAITDLLGRAWISQPIQPGKTEIPLTAVPGPGIYLVRVTSSDGEVVSVVRLVVR